MGLNSKKIGTIRLWNNQNSVCPTVFWQKIAMRRAPRLRQADGLFLFDTSTVRRAYIQSELERENGNSAWAEYTLNKVTLHSKCHNKGEILRRALWISELIHRDVRSRPIYASNVMVSSTDAWRSFVLRTWCSRTKKQQDEFDFFKCWNGEGEIGLSVFASHRKKCDNFGVLEGAQHFFPLLTGRRRRPA